MYHNRNPIRLVYVHHGLCVHEKRYFYSNKQDNYYKSNYPTDSDFIPCAYGQNEKYPMVYFPDVYDISLVIFRVIYREYA